MLPLLFPNSILKGKWNNNSYKIVKKLGEGGIGAVYEVIEVCNNKKYALKLSEDNISLNREYNLLREFKEIDIIVKGYEIDDVDLNGKTYYFIVLEYIPGISLNSYRKNKKINNTKALGIAIILFKAMEKLHEKGYILGDAKLNNIMVNEEGKVIKLIDLGGVVNINSTIKEFTPAYDRASWGCGHRIGESCYDLFSGTMILVQLILGINLNPRTQKLNTIKEKLKSKDIDKDFKINVIKVLNGEKYTIKDFANALLKIYNKEEEKEQTIIKKSLDYKMNLFFIGSLFLLISSILLNLVK